MGVLMGVRFLFLRYEPTHLDIIVEDRHITIARPSARNRTMLTNSIVNFFCGSKGSLIRTSELGDVNLAVFGP
jgi:hypothetical protein